jgi:hypothetical protein
VTTETITILLDPTERAGLFNAWLEGRHRVLATGAPTPFLAPCMPPSIFLQSSYPPIYPDLRPFRQTHTSKMLISLPPTKCFSKICGLQSVKILVDLRPVLCPFCQGIKPMIH